MGFNNSSLVIMVVLIIILLIGLIIYLSKRKSSIPKSFLPFEIAVLIKALGELDNIKEIDAKLSKVNVKVKDPLLVDITTIKELGASGIIEKSNSYTFIFGNISEIISKEINNLL
ncbi:MAG: hypothetical protein LBT75_02980 [Bacilli bacterium]|jgi:phosphotransferase system IIB component|nr:hypothetical protein [Bacilli bacterium]